MSVAELTDGELFLAMYQRCVRCGRERGWHWGKRETCHQIGLATQTFVAPVPK